MICKNCGKEFEGNFCPECGMQAGLQYTSCPKCGKERADGEKFCSGCGYCFVNGRVQNNVRISFKITFEKIYKYLIAGGMILMGIIALVCLASPVAVLFGEEGMQSGFAAIKGGEELEYDGIVSDMCRGILVISILSIVYGVAQIIFKVGKLKRKFDSVFWALDGIISVLYIILSSIIAVYVRSESSELMEVKLGSGFALHMTIGVIAFVMLWVRISYEIVPIKQDTVENMGVNAKRKYMINIKDKEKGDIITILDNKTIIKEEMFYKRNSITEIVIPEGITTIKDRAFGFCSSLKKVYIPLSVTEIGDLAFDGCGNVEIYCLASSKPSGWSSTWNLCNYPVVWGYRGD